LLNVRRRTDEAGDDFENRTGGPAALEGGTVGVGGFERFRIGGVSLLGAPALVEDGAVWIAGE
jgi:hypothetical protein